VREEDFKREATNNSEGHNQPTWLEKNKRSAREERQSRGSTSVSKEKRLGQKRKSKAKKGELSVPNFRSSSLREASNTCEASDQKRQGGF